MKINVKSLQGDEYHVDVENNQLVSELKVLISEQANGLPVAKQKLVFKGRTMQDSSSVGEYNLEEGCKVHLIVQKDLPTTVSATQNTCTTNSQPSSSIKIDATTTATSTTTTITSSSNQTYSADKESRFELILRERLAKHFAPDAVEKIMANLHDEINADINSSSLDDLERLAKQKLNISNE